MGMSIRYDKLFNLLSERKISKTTLQKELKISSATLAKFSKNELVSLKIIEEICKFLHCQVSEILEIVNDSDMPLLQRFREEMKMKLKGGLYHQTQIKLAYHSNRIEGSMLSEAQTRYIFETNTLACSQDEATSVDDIIETINHFQCFDVMIKVADQALTEDVIKEFHRLIKMNTSDSRKEWFKVGEYKARSNMVGDSKTVAPSKVKGEMAKLVINYNSMKTVGFEDLVEFHYLFESIHPFQDGNGRVGRMILFKECLRWGITPFIIDEGHKQFYYRGLKEFEVDRGYLLDTCYSAQDEYASLVKYFMEGE
jgi:DNA-binding Xre family transcriptional regulator